MIRFQQHHYLGIYGKFETQIYRTIEAQRCMPVVISIVSSHVKRPLIGLRSMAVRMVDDGFGI